MKRQKQKPLFRPIFALSIVLPVQKLTVAERELIADCRALHVEMGRAKLTGPPPEDHPLYPRWADLRSRIEERE